jgi:homoserine O-acetyltransferase
MSATVPSLPRRAPAIPPHGWPVRDETLVIRNIVLESGVQLDRIDVRFRLEGAINSARDNLVVVVHALTGTPNATAWWKDVIGEGQVLDPHKHAILCANLLGGCAGTSGPRNDDEKVFPALTIRDQARVLERVINALGVTTPLLVCGGSLGGMVTLEFAALYPDRVRQALVLAAPAALTAQGLAWHAIMRRAIAIGGANEGLALARMVGMLSYRTPASLESRFGRTVNEDGLFTINDWLYTHGERLVERFDAASYVALIDAMDSHDVGRNRGGVGKALRRVADRIIGVGIPGDLLFTAQSVREWCEATGAEYRDLNSAHGHDAFLMETEAVSHIVLEALTRAHATPAPPKPTPRVVISTQATAVTSCIVTRYETGASTERAPMRIALAGCGHVGGALLDLFREHATDENKRVHVSRVLVRDARRSRQSLSASTRCGIVASDACIADPQRVFDSKPDVLIEAIGGTTTAATLIEGALVRGIRVVTANKALIAMRGPEFTALARKHHTSIDFEGAVAAAIPIVRCLRTGAAGVGITRVTGIVNGTTNVVLERIAAGDTLHNAIAYAQSEGYAEADPARDLSGEDSADKLRVLAWLAFGVDPAKLHVTLSGIDEATAERAREFAREGTTMKLLATCGFEDGALVAQVAPVRVHAADAWANVRGPDNRITVDSTSARTLVFHGAGAGGRATAGALFGDLLHPTIADA